MIKTYKILITLFISLLAFGQNSFAQQQNCHQLMAQFIFQHQDLRSSREALENALGAHTQQADVVLKNLDALHFIDYNHSYRHLHHLYLARRGLENSDLSRFYGNRAFSNHLDALDFLQSSRPQINLESLNQTHRLLMKQVDGVANQHLGVMRPYEIYGNIPHQYAIDQHAFDNLTNNIYIDTSGLAKMPNGRYAGMYEYANVNNFSRDVESILARRNPDLLAEIKASNNANALQPRFLQELTEDAIEWFISQRQQVGEINSAEKVKELIELVAEFQFKIVSIHPFVDGNGRTSRLFALYYPLIQENIPPPRLLDPNSDVYHSLEVWKEQVLQGVESSARLYRSLTQRLERGLSVEGSAELVFPATPRQTSIPFRQQSPQKNIANHTQIDIDPYDFNEFLFQSVRSIPDANDQLQYRPYQFFKDITESYIDFIKRSHLVYVHKKFGQEYVALRFVNNLFRETFADQSFRSTMRWQSKMDDLYFDDIIWRGLANQHREVSETEILNMFVHLSSHNLSNNALRNIHAQSSPDQIRRVVFNEFDRFNRDLFDGNLVRMARDHSESGPLYGESYGFSTSKNRTVGKAFAMGAMVVARYGEHQQYQHLLRSRILVGMKRAHKDVDLTRLKQVREDFSYRYGRQQEVMAIGAADPDSVMFIQTLDANGDVIFSYVRNPEAPHIIVVTRGEASSWPLPEGLEVIREINLLDQF